MLILFSLMRVPHSRAGEATPSPRYPTEEILKITAPRVSVAATTIGPIPLGRMCFKIILIEDEPSHFAASTYSMFLRVNTDDRTVLAKRGI